jgi:hypothetical protein
VFVGGSGYDMLKAVTVGRDGRVVVAGDTASADFPFSRKAWQSGPLRGMAGFVAVLPPGLGRIEAASAVDAGRMETVAAVAIAADGAVVVGGMTSSGDFPVTRGRAYRGEGDAFLLRLSAGLGRLEQAVTFGGRGEDGVCALVGARPGLVAALASRSRSLAGVTPLLGNPAPGDVDILFLPPDLGSARPEYAGSPGDDRYPALAAAPDGRVFMAAVAGGPGRRRIFIAGPFRNSGGGLW